MNSEEYWKQRSELNYLTGEKTTSELLTSMKIVYKNSLDDINKEIQAFYGRYAGMNGLTLEEVNKRLNPKQLKSAKQEMKKYYDMVDPARIGKNMSEQYRQELRLQSAKSYMSRLEELKMSLRNITINLGAKENEAFYQTLKKIYSDTYSKTNFDFDKFYGFSSGFEELNFKKLNSAIHQKWLGRNFSDRIWENKGKLLNEINTTFLQGIAQGKHPDKIAETMNQNMKTGLYNCARLARTESAHIMGEATLQGYKDRNISEKYQFIATLDRRTSEICQSLDNKVFNIKDAQESINYPPMHPNCRSTTIPYFEKDKIDEIFEEAQRVARDENEKLYYIPAKTTYSEWQEMMKKKPTDSAIQVMKKVNIEKKTIKDSENIEDRFGKEFSDFLKQSQQYWNDFDENKIDTYWNKLSNRTKERIQQEVLYDWEKKLSEDEVLKELKKWNNDVKNYFNDKDTLFVRHNDIEDILDNMDDFEKDSRLKTQFETGRSSGALDARCRQDWEKNLSPNVENFYKLNGTNNYNAHSSYANSKLRPVYGEVIDRKNLNSTVAGMQYGNTSFVFNKDKIKQRTSFTFGNSSDEQGVFQNNPLRSFFNEDDYKNKVSASRTSLIIKKDGNGHFVRDWSRRKYIEFQSWGGIDFSKGDVSEVILRKSYSWAYADHPNFKKFLNLMNKYHIKVSYDEN